MLKALNETQKKSWKDHVRKLVYAYNCTKHSTQAIRHTSFYLDESPEEQLNPLEPTHKTTANTL